MARADFDHVMAGAGAAGCTPASRLCEDPDSQVLLREDGGRDTNPKLQGNLGGPG
jgi:choline dehydrogenase